MIYGIISTPDSRRRATRPATRDRERERESRALVKSFPWPPFTIIAFNGRLFQGFTVCGVRTAATYNYGMGLTNGTFFDSSRYRDSKSHSRTRVQDCFIVSLLFVSVDSKSFVPLSL